MDARSAAAEEAVRDGAAGETARSEGRRPMRADAQRNYDKIIETARAVFTEQGPDTSLEEIARRAGVGVGTLYRHFPTRLTLLESIYRGDVEHLGALAEEVVAEGEPWEALVTWLSEFSGYAATKRALMQEIVDVAGRDAKLLSYSRQVISAAAELVVGNAQRAGVARADVLPTDVTRLVGGCTMMPGADAEQQRRMVRLVLDGLRV